MKMKMKRRKKVQKMELAMDLGGKNGVGKGKLNRNPKNPNKYQEKNFP